MRQLGTAAERATELGLEVTFVRADVVDLSALEDGSFDLVYTGGHVAVRVSDLKAYYSEGRRILHAGGMFMAGEYHPFRRTWQDSPDSLKMEVRYFDRGAAWYDRSRGVPGTAPETLML